MVSQETLDALIKAQNFQAGAWQRVITAARKYQQMKLHGSYMDNSNSSSCIHVSHGDRKNYEELFHEELMHNIASAFLEDAMMGQALQSAGEAGS